MENSTHNEIDWSRIAVFFGVLAVSLLIGWFGQPFVHGNEEARGVVVNVFSILAGFLITVMTLLGEPGLYRGRTWRSDAVKRSNVYRRLVRHKWLFILYLLVLGFVFSTTIFAKRFPESATVVWLERTYLCFAALAFVLSLMLPSRLMSLQLARFDELVDSRRKPPDGPDIPS